MHRRKAKKKKLIIKKDYESVVPCSMQLNHAGHVGATSLHVGAGGKKKTNRTWHAPLLELHHHVGVWIIRLARYL